MLGNKWLGPCGMDRNHTHEVDSDFWYDERTNERMNEGMRTEVSQVLPWGLAVAQVISCRTNSGKGRGSCVKVHINDGRAAAEAQHLKTQHSRQWFDSNERM